MGALRRFWSQGTGQKVALIAVAGFIVLVGCCGLLVFGSAPCSRLFMVVASQGARSGCLPAASTATATSTVSATATAVAATRTGAPKATATRTPARATLTAAASGPPELGALLLDFTAAYGPVISHGVGGSDNFYQDEAQTIIVNVTFSANGTANHISVSGPPSWSNAQTSAACAAYLPPDAVEYNSAPPNTDYHSSLGNIVLANYGGGACLVFIAS